MTTSPTTTSTSTSESTSADHTRVLRCGVVGVGRMGRHHARVYAQSDGAELVGVVDTQPERAGDIVAEWGGEVIDSVDALIEARVDAVTIATPTVHHRAVAERLMEAGIACLIEKPLAPNVEEAQAIVDAAQRRKAVLQVGHIVRYDPVMRAIRTIDGLSPQFIEVVRISPMTFRSVDVGVVLDMMIHDIDVLLMLMGNEPEEIHASAVCVVGEAEDVCNARLVFPPGSDGVRCVANVTASRLALKTERKMRIISSDMYISADFAGKQVTCIRKTANENELAEVREQLKAGADLSDVDYLNLVNVDALEVDDREPLALQIDEFLEAVRSGRRPQVDAEAGFAAVRTAERIVEAAREAGSRMI